jgi:DNA-binding NarL/FixJ family response regulator
VLLRVFKVDSGNSSSAPNHVELLYFAICEDRSFIRVLFHQWLEANLPCRMVQVSHPQELRTSDTSFRLVFISTRISPSEGRILPKHCLGAPIVFDDNFTPLTAVWWKERGAKGLLDFRDGPDEWLNCVNQVLDGRLSQTPTAKSALEANDSKRGLELLSRREMQVAQLLVRGNSAEQVAKKLGTTEGTIKNQRKAIYQKLKIDRATQLAWAMGNGVGAAR